MRSSSVRKWLIDSVQVKQPAGVDKYGQVLNAASVTIDAKIRNDAMRAVTIDGEDFTSMTQIVTLYPIKVGDIVIIDGTSRPARAVKSLRGLRGGTTIFEVAL
jgi:hypothetical protein